MSFPSDEDLNWIDESSERLGIGELTDEDYLYWNEVNDHSNEGDTE